MESTPVIDYTVPELRPNILVDQMGYSLAGEKEATAKGRELPTEFALIDAETEEEVFRGKLGNLSYSEELDLYTGKMVFTDFLEEGTYYLQCAGIGRSLDFVVSKDLYGQLFGEVYQELMTACQENRLAVSDVIGLLTAFEWYPEVFPDQDGNEIPDVCEEIAHWIQRREQTESDETHGTLYVAALAKFSYLYQNFDLQFATECLQHASVVFAKMQAPVGEDADNFCALTELYRATGLYSYRIQIQDYTSFFEGNSSYLQEPSYLFGAMTYLVTRQRVDVDLCDTFMEDIMDRGEEISNRYEEMLAPLNAKNNGAEDLLSSARGLFCCNYILNNYEYTNIIEDFLHYLGGRNLDSICFYPEEGNASGYLLLFSQLAATEGE